MKYYFWTAEEDRMLEQAARKGVSVQRLAVKLRRPERGIKTRAKKLGFVLPQPSRAQSRDRSPGVIGSWKRAMSNKSQPD